MYLSWFHRPNKQVTEQPFSQAPANTGYVKECTAAELAIVARGAVGNDYCKNDKTHAKPAVEQVQSIDSDGDPNMFNETQWVR